MLGGLRAPLGVHAVLGNHDWWEDKEVQRAGQGLPIAGHELEAAGIPVYENNAKRLNKNGRPFWIAGLGDQLAYVPMRRCAEHEFLTYIERDSTFYSYPIHRDEIPKMPDRDQINSELSAINMAALLNLPRDEMEKLNAGQITKLNGAVDHPTLTTLSCFASHCDWRMPTVDELKTIEDAVCAGVAPCVIDAEFIPNRSGRYWTSSTRVSGGGAGAYFVDFNKPPAIASDLKTVSYFARAVRRF